MKAYCNKIARVLKTIFGYGILTVLVLGGLSLLGFLVALLLGGTAGEALAVFLYRYFFTVLAYATAVLILLGLLSMYLAGESALTAAKRRKK